MYILSSRTTRNRLIRVHYACSTVVHEFSLSITKIQTLLRSNGGGTWNERRHIFRAEEDASNCILVCNLVKVENKMLVRPMTRWQVGREKGVVTVQYAS